MSKRKQPGIPKNRDSRRESGIGFAPNPLQSDAEREAASKVINTLRTSGLSGDDQMRALKMAAKRFDQKPNPELDEIFKRSPAMAMAKHLMDQGAFGSNLDNVLEARRPDEEPSLADMFIASTYKQPKGLHGRKLKRANEVHERYRDDMRHAHRFVLDDEFVEIATEMATIPAEKLLARLQYATLPYEQTWIEFNLRAKVRALRRLHRVNDSNLQDIAPRLGMLLQRISNTTAVCTLITEIDGEAMIHMTSYFFSADEQDFEHQMRPAYGCLPLPAEWQRIIAKQGQAPADGASPNYGRSTLWGYTTRGVGGLMQTVDKPTHADSLITPSFLIRHGEVGTSRAFQTYMDHVSAREELGNLADLIITEVREFTGHMRWTVTVLAMLNEVPVDTTLVEPSHQMRVGHFKKRKFLDYHRVTLRLPKLHPVAFVERHLKGASERRHRAHEVRGHWRTYLRVPHCMSDEHQWEYDYENDYRLCGKCMAFGRFIHEHVRGNAELGWVRKDYVLKSSL